MKWTYIQKIEKYLSGQMSEEEIQSFEQDLQNFPDLKKELNFQSEVIKGISSYRKSQLKARLDTINVSSSFINIVQQSFWAKVTLISGISLGVILGLFYGLGEEEKITPKKKSKIEINAPQEQELTLLQIPIQESKINKSKASTPKVESFQKSKRNLNKKNNTTHSREIHANIPQVDENNEKHEFQPVELDIFENIEKNEKSNPIEIEMVKEDVRNLYFKYFSGKLFLYGDVDSIRYEILEINSKKGREIYLYQNTKYYSVFFTDKKKKLQPITDQELIKELNSLRN